MTAGIHVKDIYGFPGFRAKAMARLHPLDPCGVIITLQRRQKKRSAAVAARWSVISVTAEPIRSGTWTAACGTSTLNSSTAGSCAPGARP